MFFNGSFFVFVLCLLWEGKSSSLTQSMLLVLTLDPVIHQSQNQSLPLHLIVDFKS